MAEGGISDEELLRRLSAIYGEAFVAGVAQEFADTRAGNYTSENGMNEAFAASRDRFTEKRKDGARRMRGSGKAAAGVLGSLRDLCLGIE